MVGDLYVCGWNGHNQFHSFPVLISTLSQVYNDEEVADFAFTWDYLPLLSVDGRLTCKCEGDKQIHYSGSGGHAPKEDGFKVSKLQSGGEVCLKLMDGEWGMLKK